MKSLIIKYMLLCIFLSGTVMPVHAYMHELDCSPAEELQLTAGADSQSDTQTANCDHCCHFSSHSVGMYKSNDGVEQLMKASVSIGYSIHYHFSRAAPPYHPPILA
jgi:hypothetical protein